MFARKRFICLTKNTETNLEKEKWKLETTTTKYKLQALLLHTNHLIGEEEQVEEEKETEEEDEEDN